jgi:hypothetical protein
MGNMRGFERVTVLKRALYTACERGWSTPPGFCINDFFRDIFHNNSTDAGRNLMDLRFCVALWYKDAERRLADLKSCQDVAEYLLQSGF